MMKLTGRISVTSLESGHCVLIKTTSSPGVVRLLIATGTVIALGNGSASLQQPSSTPPRKF
jgi:hypothetical protein